MIKPLFFSDAFEVNGIDLKSYGAFNISLVNDLPLFIDPFLLFNSKNEDYVKLHEGIIKYLVHLKAIAQRGPVPKGIERELFRFPEIKENWMGFSLEGNKGRGLGGKFSKSIIGGFNGSIRNFGEEDITRSAHLEKICLLQPGIGKDFISDFTLNMCLGYIAGYTEKFAREKIDSKHCGEFLLRKSEFNYSTGTWMVKSFISQDITGCMSCCVLSIF